MKGMYISLIALAIVVSVALGMVIERDQYEVEFKKNQVLTQYLADANDHIAALQGKVIELHLRQKVLEDYANNVGAMHRKTLDTIAPFRSVQDVMDALRECLKKVETPNVPNK